MARPKMPDGEARSETVHVRVKKALKVRLDDAAKRAGMTPSEYVRSVLVKHFTT